MKDCICVAAEFVLFGSPDPLCEAEKHRGQYPEPNEALRRLMRDDRVRSGRELFENDGLLAETV
jgi:hypothetical protein